MWISQGQSSGGTAVSTDDHNHHDRQFVRSRAPSPAGITPTGDEVHAYAPGSRGSDVVLFTASRAGTFIVQCDLHPEKVGKLTVFDPAETTVSPRRRQALARALSRDLGSVDYPEASDVLVEATYATPEYVTQALGGAPAMAALKPDSHVAFLLTERTHINSLPEHEEPPALYVAGSRVRLVDSKVITDSVHHRATFYR